MSDWYLPATPGLVLTYEDHFDEEKSETRVEVLGIESRGEASVLTLERTKRGRSTIERLHISSEGAWREETRIWQYPVEEREWDTEDPRVGRIHHRLFFSDPVELAGERFERVVQLTHASEGGQSTQLFAPTIGLLCSHYLADGTPGGSILKSIERTVR